MEICNINNIKVFAVIRHLTAPLAVWCNKFVVIYLILSPQFFIICRT
jgi:hypothetical protein